MALYGLKVPEKKTQFYDLFDSYLVVHLVRASPSGLCRAEHFVGSQVRAALRPPTCIRTFTIVGTLSVRYHFIFISSPYRPMAHGDGENKAIKTGYLENIQGDNFTADHRDFHVNFTHTYGN